jgi:hypothetical protein
MLPDRRNEFFNDRRQSGKLFWIMLNAQWLVMLVDRPVLGSGNW